MAIAANRREQLERLCRYVSHPPVASERLAYKPLRTELFFDDFGNGEEGEPECYRSNREANYCADPTTKP